MLIWKRISFIGVAIITPSIQLKITLPGLIFWAVAPLQAAETEKPHHMGLAFGGAGYDNKTSTCPGLDYSYRFKNNLAVFLFAEGVSGDFDIEAYGFGLGKFFESGWKTGADPGVERKLKSGKNFNLFHISTGYDWHKGPWSYSPVAAIDFIEQNSDTYYFGWAIGYGF